MSQSQENNEDELEELSTWQEIAEKSMNIITFNGAIEDFTLLEPENEEDRLPDRLLEVGNTILYISMKIESVRSHKEDFERLLGHASSLVVVFWQLCNKSEIPGKLWPPPNLRNVIDKLVDTVYYIHKLMKRKSEESLAKRIVVGYFGLRDLRKFKKYQRKLDAVASSFESEPHNVKINNILLEVIRNRTQGQDEDSSAISEEPVEVPVRKKKRAVDQEASAERTRSRKAKPKQNEVEESSEDGHVDVEETKAAKKKTARKQPEARSKGTKKASRCSSDEESEDKGKRTRYQESDEDVEEGHSRQRSRTTNATKSQTKKRVSPVDDDDEEYNTDVPVTPKAQPKKKKKRPVLTPKQKVESTPVSPQYSISGFSFNNGSGNMANLNVGNIYHSSISDAYNDNSTNAFQGKRKPA